LNNILRQIEIDLYSPTSYEVIKAQQGDKNSRIIEFILYDNGNPYILTDNIFFRFIGHRGDGSSFSKTEEECITRNGNHVNVTLLEDILYYSGTIEAKLVMYELSEQSEQSIQKVLSTIPFKISCIKNPCNENELTNGEYSIVTDLIFQMKEFSRDAENIIKQAKSYAVGSTGIRENEDNDNAKYYYEQAKIYENYARQYSELAGDCVNAAENFANMAEEKSQEANSSAIDAIRYANFSSYNCDNSLEYAKKAQSYANGTGDIRPNESTDNAKYYYEQARTISESFSGALRPMGTVAFANLPALITAVEGDMYNISDEFITNADFKEGAGLTIPAGSNIYKTVDGKWDILAGSPVTGIKGNAESNYRKGNVNITPENIGSPSNEYMAEHFVPDYISSGGIVISSKGWYRIAQKRGGAGFGESCVISIKRFYNSPSPEYQKVQLVDSYRSNKIIPIVSYTGNDGTHMFTKIRKTNDSQNLISYIEIYQDRDTHPNGVLIDILEAQDRYGKKWEVIDAVPTQETVEGINVLAFLDLPANFDSDSLAQKDGSNVSGIWSNLISGKALSDGDGNVIKDSYTVRKIITDGDFNEMVIPGIYTMKNSIKNAPAGTGYHALLVLQSDTGNYIEQIAFQESTFNIYVRYLTGSEWSKWERLISDEELIDKIYPIGSIYMSVSSTSPATLFGGTWVRWGNGRVPVGLDESQVEFNTTEKMGGSKYLQNHKHTTTDANYGFTTYKSGGSIARLGVQAVSPAAKMTFTADTNTKDIDYSKETASTGTGNSENLQPYITCYMWKRTA